MVRGASIAILVGLGILSGCAFGGDAYEGDQELTDDPIIVPDAAAPKSQTPASGSASASPTSSAPDAGAKPPVTDAATDAKDGAADATADTGPEASAIVEVLIAATSDCITVTCPPAAPFPVGCRDTMTGGSTKGCVASTPTGSSVYFKEGNNCDNSHHDGALLCSAQPGVGLNATNCVFNRADKSFVDNKSKCN